MFFTIGDDATCSFATEIPTGSDCHASVCTGYRSHGPHVVVQELGRAVTGVWLIPALRLGGVTTSQVVTGSTAVLFDTRSAGDGAATARGTPRRAGGQRAVTRVRSAGLGRVC